MEEKSVIFKSSQTISNKSLSWLRFYHSIYASSNFSVGRCDLSSQVGAESSREENDSEDGFSELETPAHIARGETEERLVSNLDFYGDEEDVEETTSNELAIIHAIGLVVHKVLDKWLKEGKELSRVEIIVTMVNLCKRRMYGRALQVI
ncbi:hypothetical protein PTKIN_Ptkin06aG0107800 [Pterospermum kingtungense]